ncbi:MAG: 2-amino-4-hydroxy-6-hydroxymethyldihydropteridine diphosphokinase [Rikenellaceae bacterium]
MERVILLLGGNIGDVELRMKRAVEMIEERVGVVTKRSAMVKSEPWGFKEVVAPFTNQAIEVETLLTPEELLDVTQKIERESGRDREEEREEKVRRGEKYASRKIDIDIIFYGDITYKSERLELPHPLMQERDFVLSPIVQIAPEWIHPTLKRGCKELLEELKNRDICRK